MLGLHGPLETLLATYAGAVLVNALTSWILWRQDQTYLHRNMFLMWLATMLAFVVHGAVGPSSLQMALGFTPVFLVGISLAAVINEIVPIGMPVRRLALGSMLGVLLTLGAHALGLGFFWVCAPIVIGVALPMIWVLFQVWRLSHWSDLTVSGKGLVVSTGLYVVHLMNAPFFRNDENAAVVGFMVALLLIFSLSVFASASAVEVASEARARSATQLELAKALQISLLPKNPEIHGMEVVCHMRPAEGMAGDYYDTYTFKQSSWLLIGDVTGHGLSSGLVMLMAQSTMSALLMANPEIGPAELGFLANASMHRNLSRMDDDRPMTLVAIRRDTESGIYRFSGTSERFYIARESGEIECIEADQMPHTLGLISEFARDEYTEAEFSLQPGDLLFVCTDGIIEAPQGGDYHRGLFGQERLVSLLREMRDRPLEEIRDELLERVDDFTAGTYADDISFVLARALV